MAKKKSGSAAKNQEDFKTSDLDVVIFLSFHGIRPKSRTQEDGIASLTYKRDDELNEYLTRYMDTCEHCGITFSELGRARTTARRFLIDGQMGEKT